MIERLKSNHIVTKVWKIVRWPLGIVVVLYIGLVIYRIPAVLEKEVTAEAVAAIHAQRLTMADVDGSNLPPAPDPKRVDATVEGIDENENGIRDDVELAIFKKYPNNQKVRAAELQYAMAIQMEISQVFNTPTLVAVIAQTDRGFNCLSDTAPERALRNSRINEVVSLVYNTDERREKREEVYREFMTSVKGSKDIACDVNIS